MSNLAVTELAEELRVELGNPADLEITSATLQRILQAAAEATGKALSRGSIEINSDITTMADQQAYDLPDGTSRVHDAFWGTGGSAITVSFDPDLPYPLLLDDMMGRFRSLKQLDELQRQAIEKGFGGKWEVLGSKIYLDPVPGAAGPLYLIRSTDIAVEDLPQRTRETVLQGAMVRGLRILANRRAGLAGMQSAGGLTTYSGATGLRDLAKVYEEMFKASLASLETGVL